MTSASPNCWLIGATTSVAATCAAIQITSVPACDGQANARGVRSMMMLLLIFLQFLLLILSWTHFPDMSLWVVWSPSLFIVTLMVLAFLAYMILTARWFDALQARYGTPNWLVRVQGWGYVGKKKIDRSIRL
jgi:hypothetical protein